MKTVALSLAVVLSSAAAHAATLSITLSGHALSVASPCARSVTVMPDATLNGQIVVDATADAQGEIGHLALDSAGGTARIHTQPGECWQRVPGQAPTLALRVRVPAQAAVSVDEAGSSRYTLGAIGGALAADLSGSVVMTAEAVTASSIELSGSGSVGVRRADGPASIHLSGSGSVTVDHLMAPSLAVDMSGYGHLTVGSGRIGQVSLNSSGVSGVQIGADVGNAAVDLSGEGTVHFAAVSGALTKDISGVGEVTVGR